MRLFICLDCKSIEELPDYDGPMVTDPEYGEVPAQDDLLEHLVEPHRRKQHTGNLVHVDDEHWRDRELRDQIVKQIRSGAKGEGLGSEAYAVKDTFREEAMKCFNAHRRPQDGCIDYQDRSKILGNSILTYDEKKEAKKAGLKRRQPRFLCDFCVVHTHYVQKKKFEKEGLYD